MSMKVRVAAATAALGVTAIAASPAAAFEAGYAGFSITPSAFLSFPATTPPPGLYGTLVNNLTALSLTGPGAAGSAANGNQPTRQFVAAPVESLTYVPGFNLLGGVYSITIAQQENVNALAVPSTNGLAANSFGRFAFHNTFVNQFLGYKLGDTGFYAKVGVSIVVPNGTISNKFTQPFAGNGLGNAGVPFTTIAPQITLQYISRGWSFVNTVRAEYNTVNPDSGYTTGTILRDEASLTRTFGRLTIGPSLGWIGQITNDTSSRFYNNAIFSQRYGQLGFGGVVGYDFGAFSITAFGLQDVLTYASGGTPNPITRRDTAVTTGGQYFNLAVNFKIPGIGAYNQPLDFSGLRDVAAK